MICTVCGIDLSESIHITRFCNRYGDLKYICEDCSYNIALEVIKK